MALINCPECKKEVSNKAPACIHCGYPLSEDMKNTICEIKGQKYDLSEVLKIPMSVDQKEGIIQVIKKINETVPLDGCDAIRLQEIIEETNGIPLSYTPKYPLRTDNPNENKPKCPHCQSTSIRKIGAIERGASVGLLGLGSNKINKSFECEKCGYTW